MTKKAFARLERERKRLHTALRGLRRVKTRSPDIVILAGLENHFELLHECNVKRIQTIALLNPGDNPARVHYPIPVNMAATSVYLFLMNIILSCCSPYNLQSFEEKCPRSNDPLGEKFISHTFHTCQNQCYSEKDKEFITKVPTPQPVDEASAADVD
jgi:ribosomal protein S2